MSDAMVNVKLTTSSVNMNIMIVSKSPILGLQLGMIHFDRWFESCLFLKSNSNANLRFILFHFL